MQRDEQSGAPTALDRVLAAVNVLAHGPYCSPRHRAVLLHPLKEPVGHGVVALQAERVLAATVRAAFAELHPPALAQISRAVEQALENWPPRFREQGGETHLRAE